MSVAARPAPNEIPARVVLLLTLVSVAAACATVATFPQTVRVLADHQGRALILLALSLMLQLLSVPVYGRGSMSVSVIGLLATGFLLGPGPAMAFAVLAAVAQWIRSRGLLYRFVFDAANFCLTAGAGAATYALVVLAGHSTAIRLVAATIAGIVYSGVNNGLLCLAISLSDDAPFRAVWAERFHWARFHFLAFGPLAAAATIAYERLGIVGLLAFVLPPALMLLSWRQYLAHTSAAVEEVRRANELLQTANQDLRELFQFASGLATRAHDRERLVDYAEATLSVLTGGRARIDRSETDGAVALVAGGEPVAWVQVDQASNFDHERWMRLRETLLPQLATAIEGADLAERVRKVHLDTIAALSRSMEAKDYYTGGHTERVATVALALARRMGFERDDLEAIEIGALLHDIGKIGVPEQILRKDSALEDDEWAVMKEHPVLSDYILSDIDLPPIVREIARSHHERIDGAGYPDGLQGDEIPLTARIVLVADAFDALTSDRPYRRARPPWAALEELRANAGTQFCPQVVAALEQLYREEPDMVLARMPSRTLQQDPAVAS